MKIDRTTLSNALDRLRKDPARLDEVLAETGASAAELRVALAEAGDAFGTEQRRAIEQLLDQRQRPVGVSAEGGARAHVVRAQKHKPWFLAVGDKPSLGPQLHQEPARDVDVAGQKMSKDELARALRGAG